MSYPLQISGEGRRTFDYNSIPLLLTLVIGIVLSLLASMAVQDWEHDRIQLAFEQDAHDRIASLQRGLQYYVMMPGMDGPATMEALRKLPVTAGVDTVFMTAKVQSHEVERYRKLGAMDVIAKPFDPMTLAAQIQAIWDRQRENPVITV